MNTRRDHLRYAILLPALLTIGPAAVDDSCHSVAVEDELEGFVEIGAGAHRRQVDVPSSASVSLQGEESEVRIAWQVGDDVVVVLVALPPDLDQVSHYTDALDGNLCVCRADEDPSCSYDESPKSCVKLTGRLTIAHTGTLCADGDCARTLELGLVGSSVDGGSIELELVRSAAVEESHCSSCGAGMMPMR